MKLTYTILIIFFLGNTSFGQEIFDWNPERPLSLSDFQSKRSTTSGDKFFIMPSGRMGFEVSMSNYEFMLTKNFNSKVSCTFNPKSSVLIATDEESAKSLLKFAQYQFDVNELYARKFRKLLFENKKTFSDISYVNPLFEQVQNDLSERIIEASETTNLGLVEEKLLALHLEVLDELETYKDFCRSCKPPKVKKN